jgi:2-phosphoglycerate kinase
MTRRDWQILLIGGGTGTGKTRLSEELARHFDVRVVEGDILRWAVEAAVAEGVDPDLHVFRDTSMWELPWQDILERSMRLAVRMCRINEAVLARQHYVKGPLILEAFWITPEFARQGVYDGVEMAAEVRSLFLYEPDVEVLRERIYGRDGERGLPSDQPSRLAMFYEHNLLMKQRAEALSLPILESWPFETLLDRALAALA